MKHLLRAIVFLALLLGSLSLATAQESMISEEAQAIIDTLPPELQALYQNTLAPVYVSAYDDFDMPDKPWRFCYSESYQGNPWRVSLAQEVERMVGLWIESGDAESFEMADSNGDVALQISQIRAFIDKGCSVIMSVAGSSTGLDEVVKASYDAGIPFITISSSVTSPYAINVDSNYYSWGYDMGMGIAEELGGKGNVLAVNGIAGAVIVEPEHKGLEDAFAQYPDIKIVAEVNGDWTPTVTKSAVLQALATNPTQIDAVWTTGSETRVVAESFVEAGRPVPWVSGSVSGDALGYWNENRDTFKFVGHAVLPSWNAQTLVRVTVRLLEGQQPKLNTLMIPIPAVKQDDLPNWYGECMTPDSSSIFPVAPSDPMPEDLMNEYFVNGAATPQFDYATTPDPCAAS